jgi:hypothetical protein
VTVPAGHIGRYINIVTTVRTREPHQKYPNVADNRFAGLGISSHPNANPKAGKNKEMYLSP